MNEFFLVLFIGGVTCVAIHAINKNKEKALDKAYLQNELCELIVNECDIDYEQAYEYIRNLNEEQLIDKIKKLKNRVVQL